MTYPQLSYRALVIPLLTLALLTTFGCNSGCPSKNSAAKLAKHFPADTEAAFAVPNLGQALLKIDASLKSEALDVPTQRRQQVRLEELTASFAEKASFDLRDPDAWAARGIKLDGAVFGGVIKGNPILCAPVSDAPKFDAFLTETVGPALDTDPSARHREERVGDHFIHAYGDTFAWTHIKGAACATSTAQAPPSNPEPIPTTILANFLKGPGDAPLSKHVPFQHFQNEVLASSLFGLFHPAAPELADNSLWSSFVPEEGTEAFDEFFAHTSGIGIGLSIENDILRWRLWMGDAEPAPDETEPPSISLAAHTLPWANFATDETLLAARTSMHPLDLWNYSREDLTDEDRQRLDALFESVREVTDYHLDIKEDLIDNLSGQTGLFIYRGDQPVEDILGFMTALQKLRALAIIQFIDAQKLEALHTRMLALISERPFINLEERPLRQSDGTEAPDITLVEHALLPITIYRHGKLLVFATNALSENEVAAYLRGQRAAPPLSGENSALGGPFASAEHLNAVFARGEVTGFLDHIADYHAYIPKDVQETSVRIDALEHSTVLDVNTYPAGASILDVGAKAMEVVGENVGFGGSET